MNPHGETGISTFDGARVSARVLEYLQAAGMVLAPDASAPPYWGGAFLAWVAIRAGLTPPANAVDPEAWREWGQAVSHPEPGCIAVLTGGGGATRCLVGVVQRADGSKLYLFGGDLSGKVGVEAFDMARVIECRRVPSAHGAITLPQAITVQTDATPAAMPIASVLPQPSSDAADLQAQINQLRATLEDLKRVFVCHDHQPVKADGTPIAWDDFVLKSELVASSAA